MIFFQFFIKMCIIFLFNFIFTYSCSVHDQCIGPMFETNSQNQLVDRAKINLEKVQYRSIRL